LKTAVRIGPVRSSRTAVGTRTFAARSATAAKGSQISAASTGAPPHLGRPTGL